MADVDLDSPGYKMTYHLKHPRSVTHSRDETDDLRIRFVGQRGDDILITFSAGDAINLIDILDKYLDGYR